MTVEWMQNVKRHTLRRWLFFSCPRLKAARRLRRILFLTIANFPDVYINIYMTLCTVSCHNDA